MKRRLTLLICIACLCLCACGADKDDNTLEKIRDANLNNVLQEKGQTVSFRTDNYNAENEIESSYVYLNPDRVVYECKDRVEINEKGDVYGFDNVEQNFYRYLFLDGSYETFEVQVTGYVWNPDETVLSKEEKDGELIVRAQDGGEETLANMAAMMSYYGFDVPETFTIINEYIMDPETYEINCYNVYANFGDEDILLIKSIRIDNPKAYEVDSKITDAINAEDCRVVTIIADPGTDDEKVYKQTIAKGCIIRMGLSMEYPSLYTDEACTQEYTGGADLNKDLTLYTVHEHELL
ncbi:MAG: hypothetical protein KBS63_05465 [Clostridiales bacterium]|nr:hypothetical protein [Candidatus Crickella caballi]